VALVVKISDRFKMQRNVYSWGRTGDARIATASLPLAALSCVNFSVVSFGKVRVGLMAIPWMGAIVAPMSPSEREPDITLQPTLVSRDTAPIAKLLLDRPRRRGEMR
jgi:hypothetical protein